MLLLSGEGLTVERFIRALKDKEKVKLTDSAWRNIHNSYEALRRVVDSGQIVYGVNTGVGELARVILPLEQSREFQKKLVLSHSVSMGEPLAEEVVRGAMILRLNAFARGYSGVNPDIVNLLLAFVNNNITPLVREIGSLGASGDLGLLAGIASNIIGEGEAYYNGRLMPAKYALTMAGLKPVELSLKDGLALINGTSFTTSMGAIAIYNSFVQFRIESLLSAITVEVLGGSSAPFNHKINALRASKGQALVARYIRNFIKDSALIDKPISQRIQDPYSLRCIPQILGGIYDVLDFAEGVVTREMNTPSDNPLVLAGEDKVLSCGNFHAEAIALALDSASLACAELGSISERHINRLLDPNLSGLPAFLAKSGGINSGLMLLHYTAWDALAENKVLTHPAATGTASVSAQQEDHSSLGFLSARKLTRILKNNWIILAAENVCALQSLDFRNPIYASSAARSFHAQARKRIQLIDEDVLMYPILDTSLDFLKQFSGAISLDNSNF
jgi:histidine ammonia-lyase